MKGFRFDVLISCKFTVFPGGGDEAIKTLRIAPLFV
jgi:hypothetical protein